MGRWRRVEWGVVCGGFGGGDDGFGVAEGAGVDHHAVDLHAVDVVGDGGVPGERPDVGLLDAFARVAELACPDEGLGGLDIKDDDGEVLADAQSRMDV